MSARLDTLWGRFYKARPLWLAGWLLLPLAAAGETVSGAQLPDGAQKVAENRYRSPQNFEETLKYYRTVYPAAQYPRKQIVNQPGVKAVHIANPSGRGFEGINIYEANDEVRLYVVVTEPAPKPPPKKKGKK